MGRRKVDDYDREALAINPDDVDAAMDVDGYRGKSSMCVDEAVWKTKRDKLGIAMARGAGASCSTPHTSNLPSQASNLHPSVSCTVGLPFASNVASVVKVRY